MITARQSRAARALLGWTQEQLADEALRERQPVFDEMYSSIVRPSIPPEHLLKATLLMALYGLRSQRLFCEQLGDNMLFKWFLEMQIARRAVRPLELLEEPGANDGVRRCEALSRRR